MNHEAKALLVSCILPLVKLAGEVTSSKKENFPFSNDEQMRLLDEFRVYSCLAQKVLSPAIETLRW